MHIYAVLKITESLIWWAFVHFVQYVQYIFTRMEKKNKKAGRVGGNTPYITRVRVREKTLHTLHKVHKAPPGVDLLGGAKVHFVQLCSV